MSAPAWPWSPSRCADLRELWNDGLTASAIAAEMGGGLTRNAVIGKARRMGLAPRPSPIEAKRKEEPKWTDG